MLWKGCKSYLARNKIIDKENDIEYRNMLNCNKMVSILCKSNEFVYFKLPSKVVL